VTAVDTATPIRSFSSLPCMVIDAAKMYKATVVTSLGTFVAVLDPKAAPTAVNNLYFLAREHFYDGLVFHRVEPWVIQTGDPRWGNSQPKPDNVGYRFADELPPEGYKYRRGDMLMANSGPQTNSSQWWVVPNEQAASLPLSYTLFGCVVEGIDVVTAISQVPTNPENKYPLDPPTIISLTVEPGS